MINVKLVTWSAGIFTAISYLLCVLYGLITPEAIHMHQFLETVLPAFSWLSLGSFLLGLIESFLWGVYIGFTFSVIYNLLFRRWGYPKK